MAKMQWKEPVHIVFLGGGYTTIWAYRSLLKQLKAFVHHQQILITIISPDYYHTFHGWTGEIINGVVAEAYQKSSLRKICRDARIIRGMAVNVDLTQQQVKVELVEQGEYLTISYDHLIFGCGSFDHREHIPGLARYGWSLKVTSGPERLRDHLFALAEKSEVFGPEAVDESLLSIVIAGGGFAGVESCAAIAEFFQVLQRYYPTLKARKPRITLVHAGETLLPQLQPHFSRLTTYATKQLKHYGVDICTGVRIENVTSRGATLSDGSFISALTVVSTLGQHVVPIPGSEALIHREDGRLCTDEYLHVETTNNLWAGGDFSYTVHPIKGKPCPLNALWAIKHGQWIGENIARTLQGKRLRRFSYPGLGQAASMGMGKGMVELYGILFTGWFAWLMRVGLFLYFMPSRKLALRTFMDFLLLPVLGRHLTPSDHVSAHAAPSLEEEQVSASIEA